MHVAVRQGPLRAIPGADVFAAPELTGALPDADVLIGGVAQAGMRRLAALPARCGRPLLLFQGYTTPGNARVLAALDRRPAVLTVADWLTADARARGCRAAQFAPGLDRDVFFPGPPAAQRAPVVTVLSHHADWKGGADAQAALALVRERRPGVEVRTFGGDHPLDRPAVAALLRETAVFVCASWEEGLGLPGIEALACGAALATTDTKGSRDYAEHGVTALVSPPRAPRALADHILALLDDPVLRGRLADAGGERVRARYPTWPAAADRFLDAVAELTS